MFETIQFLCIFMPDKLCSGGFKLFVGFHRSAQIIVDETLISLMGQSPIWQTASSAEMYVPTNCVIDLVCRNRITYLYGMCIRNYTSSGTTVTLYISYMLCTVPYLTVKTFSVRERYRYIVYGVKFSAYFHVYFNVKGENTVI